MNEWSKYFPKKYKPRQLQIQAIQFVRDTFFVKNKKFAILQAPVRIIELF